MTGTPLILDIETRPDPTILQSEEWWVRREASIEAPSNYKDPLKIEAYKDAERQKLRDSMALSPRTGMIAMIGISELRSGTTHVFRVDSETREHEKSMLEEFIDELPTDPLLIGWNCVQFDIPFIVGRCLIHRVKLPIGWPSPKNYRKVIDLKNLLGGPLDDWFYLLTGRFKDVNGPDILKISHDELEHHLREDLAVTSTIAAWTETTWRE